MKILIIEDETELSDSIAGYLKQENYLCDSASNFMNALDKIESFDYDCILLDINLPGGSGLKILEQIKANHKMDGVIMISARNSIEDKVQGLKLGADDYLAKPFHLSELGARIAALIRRKNFDGGNIIRFNEIVIDIQARTVAVNDRVPELTRKEYQLLLYFFSNKGRVISKHAIAAHLWGDELGPGEGYDFIYTHIKNLRRKLIDAGSDDYIHSVYGVGYKFSDR